MADSKLYTASNSETRKQIDKNRLVKALLTINSRSHNLFDFAWGNEISGVEHLMKSLQVEEIGNIPIPIAKKVFWYTKVKRFLHTAIFISFNF